MKAPPSFLLTQVIYAHKWNKAKRGAASLPSVFLDDTADELHSNCSGCRREALILPGPRGCPNCRDRREYWRLRESRRWNLTSDFRIKGRRREGKLKTSRPHQQLVSAVQGRHLISIRLGWLWNEVFTLWCVPGVILKTNRMKSDVRARFSPQVGRWSRCLWWINDEIKTGNGVMLN